MRIAKAILCSISLFFFSIFFSLLNTNNVTFLADTPRGDFFEFSSTYAGGEKGKKLSKKI